MKIIDLAPWKDIRISNARKQEEKLDEEGRGVEFTIPRAMVFARVLGWFFMKRRGTEKPIAMCTRNSWMRWTTSFWRWEGMNILVAG